MTTNPPTVAGVSEPRTPKRRPRVPKGYKRCDWQGYGFGASYEDAACCDGTIGDLDDTQGPGLIGLRDESCPNCGGKGVVPHEQMARGNMALIRQRQQAELRDDILGIAPAKDENAKEWAEKVAIRVDGLWQLVNKLEDSK